MGQYKVVAWFRLTQKAVNYLIIMSEVIHFPVTQNTENFYVQKDCQVLHDSDLWS
jgi:hypothetical protein